MKILISFLFIVLCLTSCLDNEAVQTPIDFIKYTIDGQEKLNPKGVAINPKIRIYFSTSIDSASLKNAVKLFDFTGQNELDVSLADGDSTIVIRPKFPLKYITKYDFVIDNQLKSNEGNNLSTTIQGSFFTKIDDQNKFPVLSDDELLTLVQRQTFNYFWQFGHPVSGLSRERNTSGDLVTSGGSGFGVMCIIVGIERGFISRTDGLERITKMSDFLLHKTERYHGVFPHWINGATGKTIPFSTKDDGGDIVETSYLIAGLLAAHEYFDRMDPNEKGLRDVIQEIWRSVEWNWHTKGSEKVLYWHWSPKYNWEMNHQLKGWNEALITYILAAASPTFAINKDVYDVGWASNGAMKNGRSYYGFTLPLGPDYGGPLFFSHYSFLGINPNSLKDQYSDYWQQNVNHSRINFAYCVANPKNYYNYSKECWGLTASDNKNGYDAHSPANDKGFISPTAAISSMPYTPLESLSALRFFYYKLGDKIFKAYGFTDAFSLDNIWFADSFLAIDQGPEIIMIENYRSGLLWNITMKNKDIRSGLDKLGFTY